MAFSEKFEDVMMVVAEKVGDNVYLSAIKDAFTAFRQSTSVGMRACSSSRRGRVVQSRCQT